MRSFRAPVALAIAMSFCGLSAMAAELPTIALSLKAHRFTPPTFSVPTGQKVRVILVNLDGATEEFDSHDLKVEELVTPHGRSSFTIGPLKPGAYNFMGEFHPDTAQGRVIAVEPDR